MTGEPQTRRRFLGSLVGGAFAAGASGCATGAGSLNLAELGERYGTRSVVVPEEDRVSGITIHIANQDTTISRGDIRTAASRLQDIYIRAGADASIDVLPRGEHATLGDSPLEITAYILPVLPEESFIGSFGIYMGPDMVEDGRLKDRGREYLGELGRTLGYEYENEIVEDRLAFAAPMAHLGAFDREEMEEPPTPNDVLDMIVHTLVRVTAPAYGARSVVLSNGRHSPLHYMGLGSPHVRVEWDRRNVAAIGNVVGTFTNNSDSESALERLRDDRAYAAANPIVLG